MIFLVYLWFLDRFTYITPRRVSCWFGIVASAGAGGAPPPVVAAGVFRA